MRNKVNREKHTKKREVIAFAPYPEDKKNIRIIRKTLTGRKSKAAAIRHALENTANSIEKEATE